MRARTITAIVVLGSAVIAAGASADFRSVDDPRGDVKCIQDRHPHPTCSDSKKHNADIVRATAGHGKNGRLKHTIRVVGKFQRGVQDVGLSIDTDSDECQRWFGFQPGNERAELKTKCRPGGGTKRRAGRVSFHRHSVEILFSKSSIGNPRRYDWMVWVCADAPTGTGSWACDHAPNGGHSRSIRHRLGDSGVAAAGVMALGAQAATAGVVPYDTKLRVLKDSQLARYHGKVKSDVKKCMEGRRVVLFKRRPGADRRVGTARSHIGDQTGGYGYWEVKVHRDLGNTCGPR